MWGLDKSPAPGLPSPYRKHLLNKGPAPPSAGLPSPSSLRDATSPKVRGLGSPRSFRFGIFTPCCRKGSRRRYAETFRLCQGLPLWGSWQSRQALTERARMLTRSCALGLALPCGSAAPSEARSKPRLCAAVSGLALSVIASRCHLSQSERPWQSAKFPVWNLCALLPQGEPKALRLDFPPLPRAPPLGKTPSGRREMSHMRQREDSWREAPERASPLAGRLCLGLAGAYDGADLRKA